MIMQHPMHFLILNTNGSQTKHLMVLLLCVIQQSIFYECTPIKSMGLACKQLFKNYDQENEIEFNGKPIKNKWTVDYYRSISAIIFCHIHSKIITLIVLKPIT